jgi:hypothetical protein
MDYQQIYIKNAVPDPNHTCERKSFFMHEFGSTMPRDSNGRLKLAIFVSINFQGPPSWIRVTALEQLYAVACCNERSILASNVM